MSRSSTGSSSPYPQPQPAARLRPAASRTCPTPVIHIALILLLLLVLTVGETPERTMLWQALFDAGHVPLFGLMALLVRDLLATRWPRSGAWRPALLSFALTVAVGAGAEFLQTFMPDRDASLTDLLRDAAGAGAFLLMREAYRRGTSSGAPASPPVRTAFAVAAVALLLAATAQLSLTLAVLAERARAFPVLARFDGSWWENALIETGDSVLTPASLATQPSEIPPGLARLDLQPATYPGLTLDEPYPDWRGYQRLVVNIVSDLVAPVPLTLRVHDAAHDNRYGDRFNTRLVVIPGANHFVIGLDEIRRAPESREMDLSRIRGIVLFAYRLEHPAHLYLGTIRLER
ncbi:MAG: succinyl-CoA synthetase subunit beta [Proteobacteria bacterium]|nr:succinyl-CoA synthetase subunit beta [Pseudomonadota bacterium]MBS1172620.1 succinyl-CoA synthetase subunit beta [Pseudomonadota bacterium]